ncbi:hypothetical protein I7I50_08796 [Histoplasma capsulatum G186AR]|uniref:Uncharacterized protein n=1 Tax=Ajellomyces capsulatus TaxID=5037 RepID=A0A8H7YP06_AJECA|nr:hypothetical protein I7I52_06310 [Histoplasma capsulatum]QSS73868.1 hypothetical protein I7I50_08796 [Histoplasma capsulatum G186AR]
MFCSGPVPGREWERIIAEWVTGAADHPLLSTSSETAAPNPGYQTTCCSVPQCSCNLIFVLSLHHLLPDIFPFHQSVIWWIFC